MKCKRCGGDVDKKNNVGLNTDMTSGEIAHPCKKCGRLHWPQGQPVYSAGGKAAYFENGGVTQKTISPEALETEQSAE